MMSANMVLTRCEWWQSAEVFL